MLVGLLHSEVGGPRPKYNSQLATSAIPQEVRMGNIFDGTSVITADLPGKHWTLG